MNSGGGRRGLVKNKSDTGEHERGPQDEDPDKRKNFNKEARNARGGILPEGAPVVSRGMTIGETSQRKNSKERCREGMTEVPSKEKKPWGKGMSGRENKEKEKKT